MSFWETGGQCDQIELFLKGLDENPSYKRSPKICNFLDDFEINEIDEIDFFHGQEYYTAVFKVLKFDLDQTKETRPKIEANSEEIDFLSLSEETLFSMPLVKEMYTTFSGFYNLKRCALAL